MEQKKPKRKLIRSPNHPVLRLDEAISRARAIFDHEKRVATTAEVILTHLGYKKNSGPGARALSALKQYGLLEEHSGAYRVTDTAFNLLHLSEDSVERRNALKEAAQKPGLFRELLLTYKDGLPSDETLKDYLLTKKGFNPDSVLDFIKIFKETIKLANLTPGTYNEVESEQEQSGGSGMQGMGEEQFRDEGQKSKGQSIYVYSWPLSMQRNVRAELRIFGADFKREDVQRLKKQLDLLEEAFEGSSG